MVFLLATISGPAAYRRGWKGKDSHNRPTLSAFGVFDPEKQERMSDRHDGG
jgi:hypothetical protein